MGIIAKLILSCIAIALSAWLTPGVSIPEVSSGSGIITLIVVAVVLALLNTFIKPIIKLLALPVTMIALGLSTVSQSMDLHRLSCLASYCR